MSSAQENAALRARLQAVRKYVESCAKYGTAGSTADLAREMLKLLDKDPPPCSDCQAMRRRVVYYCKDCDGLGIECDDCVLRQVITGEKSAPPSCPECKALRNAIIHAFHDGARDPAKRSYPALIALETAVAKGEL